MSTIIVNFHNGSSAVGGNAHDVTATGTSVVSDCVDFDTGALTGYAFDTASTRVANSSGRAASSPTEAVVTTMNTEGHYVGDTASPYALTFSNVTDMVSCDVDLMLCTSFSGQSNLDIDINGSSTTAFDSSGNTAGSYVSATGVTPDGSDEIVITVDNIGTPGGFIFLNSVRVKNIVLVGGGTALSPSQLQSIENQFSAVQAANLKGGLL